MGILLTTDPDISRIRYKSNRRISSTKAIAEQFLNSKDLPCILYIWF